MFLHYVVMLLMLSSDAHQHVTVRAIQSFNSLSDCYTKRDEMTEIAPPGTIYVCSRAQVAMR